MLRESKEIGAFTFTGIPHNNRMQPDTLLLASLTAMGR